MEYMYNTSYANGDFVNSFEGGPSNNITIFDIDVDVSDERRSRAPFCPVTFRFYWYTVITGILCLLGLTGNTLSIITLQRDKGNEVANLLLQALASADNALLFTTVLVLSIMWGGLPFFNATQAFRVLAPYFLKYIQPIGYMTKTCAIWMTVLLAINRYIVIRKPLQAHHICTLWKARFQVLTVILFSIVCNLPRFFRFRIYEKNDGNTTFVTYEETSIGKGSLFHIIYTNVLYTILVLILPLFLLVFLNVSLILELKKMRQLRSLMNVSSQPSESNITLVMCIIIVTFIVCHTPDRVLQGIISFYKNDWWEHSCYLVATFNMLIVINSSSNFLVYYFVRKRFRKLLYHTLCSRHGRRMSDVKTFVFPADEETETEISGPMTVLRRLSRSMTDLLFKHMDTNDSGNITNDANKHMSNSNGSLLDVNDFQTRRKSESVNGLLDVPQMGIQVDK